jgi:hypothetical protein
MVRRLAAGGAYSVELCRDAVGKGVLAVPTGVPSREV